MSEHAVAQQQNTNTSKRILSNAVNFQWKAVNHDEPTALPEWKGDTLPGGAFAEPSFGHDFSGVPPFTAMVQKTRPLLHTQLMVQRYPKDGTVDFGSCPTCPEAVSPQVSAPAEPATETAEPASGATPTVEPAEPGSESAALEETTAPALLVEDSTTELAPGQMRKSDFLAQLRTEVNRAAEAAMVGTGRTTRDCPYLNYWFGYYRLRDSAHIERAIHRYAPEASNATTASGYISAVTQRVRQSAETWARTGEVTGVPQGIPVGLPVTGLMGGLLSGIGSIFFKAREGGARAADDPQVIQRELGEGQLLDSGVRSRMGSAFGTDFSHVRIHTDNTASELSNRFNACAFAVGEHVAFGAGEYKPGTLIGDALIAHELAHVVQQGAATSSPMPMTKGAIEDNTMEKGADLSAIGAVTSLWGQFKGEIKDKTVNTLSRFRTGLRLQRCASTPPVTRRAVFPPVPVDLTQQPSAPCNVAQRRMNPCCTSTMIDEIEGKVGEAIPIVRNTISRLSSSPEGVRSQLWDNFRIRSEDSRIPLVLGQFRSMLTEMEGHDVIFQCSDFADPLCEGGYRGRSSNCQNSRPRYMQLCGDYIWHVDDPDSNYLSTRSSINWVKTIIHEYAHIGCITPPGILGEGNEFYKGRGTYPPANPDIAIKNADSYAWFAMEVR